MRKEVVEPELFNRLHDRFFNIIYGFLGPIFFVSLSFHVDLNLPAKDWWFLAAIIVVATIAKVGGCALPARIMGRSWQEATVIGLGMNGRGAVELIVAKAVLLLSFSLMEAKVITEPLLTQSQFTILILMAFVTTFLTPISLRAIVPPLCAESDKDFCELWRSAQ